ncbi:DUF2155 domain-containing protein [Lichenihabitans sp. Uapishka_5]|uniref:DUF2155 domain-containing protein n=1 Tax=Lichenihabitans sp. Uapishka_5 TaxID=3037302 RepID=UPI0029E7EDC2|nr:DUF2155 domain-containing protein [Lichenihabitans sp. Uapishka_5]MDX7951161.1 DUF2155 domain-containing protein [Lichenihabitans sp. Uapishka_5]
MVSFRPARIIAGIGLAAVLAAPPALADKIKNPVAVFSGLDKITGRIISFEAKIDETVQFGSLQVTPRVCYTRPQTETPQTDAFTQVDEVQSDKTDKQIFSGWMFSASPGLHGVEHPVYDVWLTDCKGGTQVIADVPSLDQDPNALPAALAPGATPAPAAPVAAPAPPKPRRVVRRQEPPPVAIEPERREPSQSFFPTNSYSNDFGGKDPAGK